MELNAQVYVQDIHYDAKGQRQAIWYGNGTKTSYTYDEFTFRLRRLLTVNLNNNEILQDLNYWYDPVGNITELQDHAQQTLFFNNSVVSPTQAFIYDALYRLKEASGRELIGTATFGVEDNWNDAAWQTTHKGDSNAIQNYTQKYTYDAVGNILELRHIADAGAYTRTYNIATDNNRMLHTTVGRIPPDEDTYSYAYDIRGNMTEMPHLDAMHWNLNNELHKLENGTMEAFYQYSGGQRIRKYVDKGSIKEERIYLGSFEIYRKFDHTSSLVIERQTVHVSDDTGRIAMLESRTVGDAIDDHGTAVELVRYIYSNHLQSASLELDQAGEIISYEEYNPYGTTSYQAMNVSINAVAKRYRYTGKERDEESGLYYHGARYFIPWLARWTSTEPLNSLWYNSQNIDYENVNSYQDLNNTLQAKYPTLSPYNYCANNPILFVDPNGREIWISYYNYVEGKKRQEQDKPIFVKYENGRLTNPDGTDYTGDNEYILMVKGVIDDVRATDDRFERVISFMENDNFKGESVKHYISNVVQRLEGPHFKEPYDYRSSLMGNGSQVQETNVRMFKGDGFLDDFINAYNASLTIKFVPDIDMNRGSEIASEFTKETIFTHELKHLFNKRFNRVIPTKYGNATGLRYEERDAMHFENIYRHAKGLNVRTKYSLLKDGTYSEFLQEDYINLSDYKLDTKPIDLSNMSLIPKGKGTWD